MSAKTPLMVTEREKKLIEKIRRIKYAKEMPITIVDGEPTKIGTFREDEVL